MDPHRANAPTSRVTASIFSEKFPLLSIPKI